MKRVKVTVEFEVEVDVEVESTEELMEYIYKNVYYTTMNTCSSTIQGNKSQRNHEVFNFKSVYSLQLENDSVVISKHTE